MRGVSILLKQSKRAIGVGPLRRMCTTPELVAMVRESEAIPLGCVRVEGQRPIASNFVWDCRFFRRGEYACDGSRRANEDEGRDGAVVLMANYDVPHVSTSFLEHWEDARLRVCADGGANVLHSHLRDNCDDAEHIRRLRPDIIIGDLDSLKPHVRDEFESMGTQVVKVRNENTTDLEKALDCVVFLDRYHDLQCADECAQLRSTLRSESSSPFEGRPRVPRGDGLTEVMIMGGMGGSFGHVAANINTALLFPSLQVMLVSNRNVGLTLRPGHHQVMSHHGLYCALLPLCGSVVAHTTGLEYDLDGSAALEYGRMISTSNRLQSEGVGIGIEGDGTAFFTIESRCS